MPDQNDNQQPVDPQLVEVKRVEDSPPPPMGEQTGVQGNLIGGVNGPTALLAFGGQTLATWGFAGGPIFGNGGSIENPCGYPGWGNAYGGVFWVYDWMLQHPVIRHARSIVCAPLEGSTWYYEHDEGEGEAEAAIMKAASHSVEKCFNRLRPMFMPEALRFLDYGPAFFEPIWDVAEGYWTIARLKSLDVARTVPLRDAKGNVVGLRNSSSITAMPVPASADASSANPGDLLAALGKAFWVTHDGKAGDPWGRSRLENIRQTAWRDWLDCSQQIQALGGKLSGRQAYAMCPIGTYKLANGTDREFRQDAIDALTAFAQGKCPVMTNLSMNARDADLQAKLAAATLVKFEVIDFGNEAPAIKMLQDRQRHAEELMFMGYLRSPRVGMEGQYGTKAEAESHTDTGMMDSQLIGDQIAAQLQPLVDRFVYLNFGLPEGTVRIRQSPLVDGRKLIYTDLLKSLNFSPQMQLALEMAIDFNKVLDALDVPTIKDADQSMQNVLAAAAQQQQEQAKASIAQAKRDQQGPPADKTQMSRDAEIALAVAEAQPDPATLALGRVAESLASRPQAAPVVNYVPPPMHFAPVTNLPPPPAMTVNVEAADAPAVNVPVSVAAPVVNLPEQPAPVVNVTVEPPAAPRVKTVVRNDAGDITEIREE